MKKEKINNVMNCNCLQDIIEYDENSLISITTKPLKSEIIFEIIGLYRETICERETIVKDRNEECGKSVPFLFCPICGMKSKLNIPKGSFYRKFQKNNK